MKSYFDTNLRFNLRAPQSAPSYSIQQRLSLAFLALSVVVVLASAGGLWFTASVRGTVNTTHQGMNQVMGISSLRIRWLTVVATVDHLLLTRQASLVDNRLASQMEDFNEQMEVARLWLSGPVYDSEMGNRETAESLRLLSAELNGTVAALSAAARAGNWARAQLLRQTDLAALQQQLDASLAALDREVQAEVSGSIARSNRIQSLTQTFWIATAFTALAISTALAILTARSITRPIRQLTVQVQRVTQRDFSPVEPLTQLDELGDLSRAVALMTGWLKESYEKLEERVAVRTRELERRSLHLQVAAEVARDATRTRELAELLDRAVNLIRTRFGFYHAGLFLLDDRREWAVLKAATGEAGRTLLAGAHQLKVGEVGIVGYVAGSGQPRIALDVGQDAMHFKNPLLPETRSEMALPLKAGEQVIGVLDVQSQQKSAFSADDLHILQILADQLAVAIENTRLLNRVQDQLGELEILYGQYNREAWEIIRRTQTVAGYQYDGRSVTPIPLQGLGGPAPSDPGVPAPLVIPLEARGESIGAMEIWPGQAAYSSEDQEVLAEIGERLSQAIESARDFQVQQQTRVEREALLDETEALYQASARLNAAASPGDILEVLRQYTLLGGEGIAQLSIFLFDRPWMGANRPDWLVPVAHWGQADSAPPSERYSLAGWQLVDLLLHPDLPTVIEDAASDPRMDQTARRLFIAGSGASSLILAPLNVGGKWIGQAIALFERPTTFSEPEVRRLMSLVGQAAVSLERLRLLNETRRRADELLTAAEIARDTSSTLALDNLLGRAVQLICKGFQYEHASLFLLDEDGCSAVVRAAAGSAGEIMARSGHRLGVGSRSIVGYVTLKGEPLVVNDVTQDAIHRPNPLLPDTLSEAGVPLKIGTRVIGALDVQSNTRHAFQPDDISVLQILADQIAVAVDNARAYELAQAAVEEMRKADRLKSQFLANMSHELRTPLNSIIGFSRVILKGIDGPVTPQQQEDLNAIYHSGQHLLNLITDILDLSKIEAGKMELSIQEGVDLAELVNSVMSTAAGLVKDKPIELQRRIAANLPPVRADVTRLRQVLINLLSNAAKFTESGTITVEARLQAEPDGRRAVRISVTDTGIGIAAEDQLKLFQPFSQVDASPTRKTGGSGLGLSISRRLVELHGGRIDLTSEPGCGSTFYITLPIPAAEHPPRPAQFPPGAGLATILAIDDDPQVIALYERYLAGHGFQVAGLTDPVQAVESARTLEPYAITLDLVMPARSGWQVLEDLKADPATQTIPVLLCGVSAQVASSQLCGAAGALTKPILEDDLVAALERLNGRLPTQQHNPPASLGNGGTQR